ncbi:echinoderm microtubule-associated protein-like 2 [Littorina saxatilis]
MHNEKGDLMTGDSNGTVYIWGDGGNRITNFVKHGHDGPVLCVLYHKGCLLTGGRDGNLSAWTWDKNMDKAATLHIPPSEGGVRTLLLREGHLIVSTTMNSLLSVTIATTGPCPLDGVSLDPIPITQGHYDELRALTVIPDSFLQADVLTAGTDGVLCKFNSHSHAPVWKLFMKGMQYLCVDCSTIGDVIVLGTKDGRVLQLEIDQNSLQVMEIVKEKVSTNAILCISLSPDNRWIAAGGEDNSIYLFRLSEQQEEEEEGGAVGWKVWGVLKGHGRQVVCVDWTLQPYTDGVYLLRSCSATPEQKFWNVLTCQEVDGGQLTTLTWASSTCTLDHLVTGVWRSKQAETARVNAMDVSPQHTLVAMGTNQGLLSLYRFPCTKDKVFSHTYSAHQTVQAVRFTPSGHCLFTVGGHDSALFQWKLI